MDVVILSRDNAGRSQMAYGFFLREITRRKLADVEVVTAGTDPADRIIPAVRKAMQELSIDLMGSVPREVEGDELAEADYVITIGFELKETAIDGFDAENVVWTVPAVDDMSLDDVVDVRDMIEAKVEAFLDEHASEKEKRTA